MNIEITPLFLILAVIIGLLVGLLVASLFSTRESRSSVEQAPPADLAKDGFGKVVSLWYSPGGKRIVTELDGDYYRDFLVLSPDQKKRVQKILTQWSNWITSSEDLIAEKAAPGSQDQDSSPVDAEERPVFPQKNSKEISLDRNQTPFLETELLPPETKKPDTIAGQISLILERLLETSSLKEKGIKLIENTHQGVDVWIGMEKFNGIEAIPYPEAQQLIKKAVAQWEREIEVEKTRFDLKNP
ncbi:MAG: hypothetical protein NTZ74_15360 [Chloroflexi bacterium]|nr:hypothetical protein [Chloroflexota bacterium]